MREYWGTVIEMAKRKVFQCDLKFLTWGGEREGRNERGNGEGK